MVGRPSPSYLDQCEYLGFIDGSRRWRNCKGRRIYTWDDLHGEIEVFTGRGIHIGVADPVSGVMIKPAIKGRKIDV